MFTADSAASDRWDLLATFPAQLPTADARLASPVLALGLRRGGERLTGVAHAYKNGEGGGRLGNFLSHHCVLDPLGQDPASTSSARSTSAVEL
ncbi:hypothetical protein ACIOWG_05780 [Streptomyces sp. NPDC087658]|uniref:hypothetical protein n=1 Tax=Streptomyces sp. NPDC087658 TaxID=3365800 RepID=UPI003804AC04